MARGILIAAMDFAAAPEDEFHDWYDLEHIPERLRVPGFLNADRWIGTTDPKISVATYDLEQVGILHSPPYLAVGGDNASPWTKRTAKFRKLILRYEGEQLVPGDRTAPPEAAGLLHSPAYLEVGGDNASPWTRRTAKFRKLILRYEGEQLVPGERTAPRDAAGLLLVGLNVAAEHEHEFTEWYNSEHLPALAAVRGVLCARRYRGTGATQRYVALYHLRAPEVSRSAEWRNAADTPWTQRLRPHFRDLLRLECRRYTRAEQR